MTETSLKKLERKVLSLPDQAKVIIVHNDKTLNNANEFLLTIKDMRKEIGATFDPIIQKTHSAHKEAVAQKKKFELPLVDAEKLVKGQIASYMSEQERLRREEEERAREANKKAPDEVPFVPSARPLPKLTGAKIREIWKFKVENPDLVPREYLTVDLMKIGSLVRATKGQIKIPGIRVYSEKSVSAEARY